MEPIENTEYLNGYYWSLNPDLNNENSDNPQNSANNIIYLKSTKAEIAEGSSASNNFSYLSKSGVRVSPLRGQDLEYSRNYRIADSSLTSDKLKSLLKQRYQTNLSRIGNSTQTQTPLMNKLLDQRNKKKLLRLEEKNRIKEKL